VSLFVLRSLKCIVMVIKDLLRCFPERFVNLFDAIKVLTGVQDS
jgi:hypothetical protein